MGILGILYGVCIFVGLLVPLIGLMFGGHDALDLDADAGIVPFHFTAFLFGLVTLGSVGQLLLHYIHPLLGLIAALLSGALAYVLIDRFIVIPLKRSDARPLSVYDTLAQRVTVIQKIPVDGMGEVRLNDAAGAKITYLARYRYADFEPHIPIEAGADVEVVDIEDDLLIVGRIR